jgi:nitrite reductase/ring-hydroxylating ferredoxin subunit
MAARERLICAGAEVQDGERGARFELTLWGHAEQAFVIRFRGRAHAFLNRCPHAGTELDWNPGEFFDDTGLYLICATHGAIFVPESGACVGGPCRGQALRRLSVIERDGDIFLLEEEGM